MFGNKGGALFDTDDIDPEDYKRCMMQGKSQTGVLLKFKGLHGNKFVCLLFNQKIFLFR